MKKINYLLLSFATLCIVSCGNNKDSIEKVTELATEAAELSESIEDVVETVESSDAESDEVKAEEATEEESTGDPKFDEKIGELEDKADEILKKCEKIGKGVGILDIQPDQNELLEEIDELSKNPDLSAAQKKRLDKLTLKTTKIASKLATSTLGAIFGK